ncbi:T9SS type A sorting domain-containing protein [Hymenobacter ruricola]|uniref:T9SS type A sorting domain-containing protein n=1 Tax=Hymenobacter ruricola TaxID=2791023 RepID=A0ABS0HY05_9BACT|nr:T9SS type A sorting domain-containing protein [Hymenobacter ruricola]MBF9219579.1 T9SS type A sorting domain-containing protein [Hymenobacter ruricola]
MKFFSHSSLLLLASMYPIKYIFFLLRGWIASVLLTVLFPISQVHAQVPQWQMVVASDESIGSGNDYSSVTGTAVDANGNLLLTGYFTGSVNFGGLTMTSAGGSDAFVAKWNSTTNSFAWVQQAGGVGNDQATSIAITAAGIYVAGYFGGANAVFGSITLTNGARFASSDSFVAKLTDAGTSGGFIWAQRVGGTGNEYISAIAANGTSIYAVGNFDGTTATFGAANLTNAGAVSSADAFVTKLIDAGNSSSFTWAQRAGGTGNEYAITAAVIGANLYVAGSFASPAVNFGNTTLTNASNAAVPLADGFITRLTDLGTSSSYAWAQQVGGPNLDYVTGLAVSGNNVFMCGAFCSSTVAFGNSTLTNAATNGTRDAFIAKLTDVGAGPAFVWAQRAGGTDNDFANALAVDGTNVYLTGAFAGAAGFGVMGLTAVGSYDVFIAKVVDFGSTSLLEWAQHAGGADDDRASTVTEIGGKVYVGGSVVAPAYFGVQTVTGRGDIVAFLASLTDPTLTATTALRSENIGLFPNPAHGRVSVQVPALNGLATLTVLDALGRAVRTQAAPANARTVLDLGGLAPGLYAVRAEAGGTATTQRLVVE